MLVTAYALASKYAQQTLGWRCFKFARSKIREYEPSVWTKKAALAVATIENGGQVSHATLHARWSLNMYFASSRPPRFSQVKQWRDLDVCAAY